MKHSEIFISNDEKKNYLSRRTEEFNEIDKFTQSKDIESLIFLTHKLKGSLGLWGFKELSDLIKQCESLLKENKINCAFKKIEVYKKSILLTLNHLE